MSTTQLWVVHRYFGWHELTLAVLPMTDVPVKPKEQTGRSQRACLLCFLSTFTVAISIYLVYDLSLGSFSNEFVKMDSGCPITAVFHRAHDRTQSKVTSCYDEYIFEFAWCKDSDACLPSAAPPTTVSDTTPSSNQTLDARLRAAWPDAESGHTDGYTEVRRLRAWTTSPSSYSGWQAPLLLSAVDSHRRGDGSCSLSTDPVAAGTWSVAQWATCYAPKDGGDRIRRITPPYTDGVYSCGAENTPCIKLLDPSSDVAARLQGLYISGGLLAFFLLLWLWALCGHNWSCKQLFCGAPAADAAAV